MVTLCADASCSAPPWTEREVGGPPLPPRKCWPPVSSSHEVSRLITSRSRPFPPLPAQQTPSPQQYIECNNVKHPQKNVIFGLVIQWRLGKMYYHLHIALNTTMRQVSPQCVPRGTRGTTGHDSHDATCATPITLPLPHPVMWRNTFKSLLQILHFFPYNTMLSIVPYKRG